MPEDVGHSRGGRVFSLRKWTEYDQILQLCPSSRPSAQFIINSCLHLSSVTGRADMGVTHRLHVHQLWGVPATSCAEDQGSRCQ